jgi:hypothetical protein
VHDAANLEARGLPTVVVSTEQFVTAAASQAAALGTEPAMVYTRHPIQDRTDDEMAAIAERAFEAIQRALIQ